MVVLTSTETGFSSHRRGNRSSSPFGLFATRVVDIPVDIISIRSLAIQNQSRIILQFPVSIILTCKASGNIIYFSINVWLNIAQVAALDQLCLDDYGVDDYSYYYFSWACLFGAVYCWFRGDLTWIVKKHKHFVILNRILLQKTVRLLGLREKYVKECACCRLKDTLVSEIVYKAATL